MEAPSLQNSGSELYRPDNVQPLFEVTHIRAFLDERLQLVDLLHSAAFDTPGVMEDVAWITGECDLVFYIVLSTLFSNFSIVDHGP